MTTPENPPAFPQVLTDPPSDPMTGSSLRGGKHYPNTYSLGGMTLRDYFAGQALPSAVECHQRGFIQGSGPSMIAQTAYEIADAMLEKRIKKS